MLETLDFKGKGAFHHCLVQKGLSMLFVEQSSHGAWSVLLNVGAKPLTGLHCNLVI